MGPRSSLGACQFADRRHDQRVPSGPLADRLRTAVMGACRRAELDEWVDGLEELLDVLGTPIDDEAPPPHVWAGIARRIASTPQVTRRR